MSLQTSPIKISYKERFFRFCNKILFSLPCLRDKADLVRRSTLEAEIDKSSSSLCQEIKNATLSQSIKAEDLTFQKDIPSSIHTIMQDVLSDVAERYKQKLTLEELVLQIESFNQKLKEYLRSCHPLPEVLMEQIRFIYNTFAEGIKIQQQTKMIVLNSYLTQMTSSLKEKGKLFLEFSLELGKFQKQALSIISDLENIIENHQIVVFKESTAFQVQPITQSIVRSFRTKLEHSISVTTKVHKLSQDHLENRLSHIDMLFSKSARDLTQLPIEQLDKKKAEAYLRRAKSFGKRNSISFCANMNLFSIYQRANSLELLRQKEQAQKTLFIQGEIIQELKKAESAREDFKRMHL